MTTGKKLLIFMFLNNVTSSTNKTPVIGALNVAAIAPAIPHAINIFKSDFFILIFCPIILPIDPPNCAMGPSCPTDPPKPNDII